MTTRQHNNIRQLALAYYRGWISRERYAALRTAYLADISAGKEPTPIPTSEFTPQKTQTAPVTNNQKPAARDSNKTAIIIVLTVLLLLVVAAIILLNQGDNKTPEVQPQSQTSPGEIVPDQKNKPASASSKPAKPTMSAEERFLSQLEEGFIHNDSWKPDALNTLKLEWLSLTPDQQAIIRSSSRFQTFSQLLIENIVVEQQQNNIVPSDYELGLITAAKHMGLLHLVPDK